MVKIIKDDLLNIIEYEKVRNDYRKAVKYLDPIKENILNNFSKSTLLKNY